jgi:hypothetical protein
MRARARAHTHTHTQSHIYLPIQLPRTQSYLRANSSSPSQEIPCILWNPMFINMLTTAHHLLSHEPREHNLHLPIAFPCDSILPHMLRSSKRYLPSDFPIEILYGCLLSPMRATCPVQPTLINTHIIVELKHWGHGGLAQVRTHTCIIQRAYQTASLTYVPPASFI